MSTQGAVVEAGLGRLLVVSETHSTWEYSLLITPWEKGYSHASYLSVLLHRQHCLLKCAICKKKCTIFTFNLKLFLNMRWWCTIKIIKSPYIKQLGTVKSYGWKMYNVIENRLIRILKIITWLFIITTTSTIDRRRDAFGRAIWKSRLISKAIVPQWHL